MKDVAYWVGYVLMYWVYKEDITGEALLKYNLTEISESYEALHTQSVNYAIDWIKEEFSLEKNMYMI